MSHSIQSPLRPELAKLSRLSTKESTTSTFTVVKPSNEGKQAVMGWTRRPHGRFRFFSLSVLLTAPPCHFFASSFMSPFPQPSNVSTCDLTWLPSFNPDQLSRTTSRGVQYKSSGRGGAGNAREAPDYSQRASIFDGPEDFSSTKGRELRSSFNPDKIISIGRGGSGNVHSPSRDVIGARSSELSSTTEAEQAKHERLLIRKHEATRAAQMHSVGRGGVGNIAPPSPPRSQNTETSTVSQSDRKMNANMTPQAIKKMRELLPGRSSSPSWTTAL
ncbi:hypothetical protein EDB85DRAFT_265695 [Lactarius pseudohatsudake]|nr:hypothetical protein EDB85DRAFT_265695 [Lactarius pseudohatsudake]